MSEKRNVRLLGKSFDYLLDPKLREKERGDELLTIRDVEIGNAKFQYLHWKNINFINCDFVGAYEIKLTSMESCSFEGCRFSGIFAWGVQTNVRFISCGVAGASHLWGGEGSKGVFYEQCNFVGTDPDSNHWGSVGTYGEVTFSRCEGKWIGVLGHSLLLIQDCIFESMDCKIDPAESKGVVPVAVISGSKLRGTFDMASSSFQSLIIRDTVMDNLDLSGATINGDIVMERVRGGTVKAFIEGAQRLIVKNCQFTPRPGINFEFSLASNEAREVLIQDTSITGDNILVDIGGGPNTESMVFERSKLTRLDLQYTHTEKLLLKEFEANTVRLNDARIGALEFDNANFSYTLDLSNTQVKSFKQSGGTRLKTLAGFKLDGSNIKLN